MLGTETASIPLETDFQELREEVAKVCADYPGEYWRELDAKSEYPTKFVKAMTEHGFLSSLIPEEYGGSGLPIRAATVILEIVHTTGCRAAACHAQMDTMGTVRRHGGDEPKQKYLPGRASGEWRTQALRVGEPATGADHAE